MEVLRNEIRTCGAQLDHEWFEGDENRAAVFFDRYTLRDEDGHLIETDPIQTFRRVADDAASAESRQSYREYWRDKFYDAMINKHFMPGGRILASAGFEVLTRFNCFS
jgi:ribonucleoside-diphosphate reductase alpha chain